MGSRAIGLGEQRRTESALIWRRRHRGLRVLGEAAGAPASKKSEVGCGGRSRDGRKPTRLEEGNASRRADQTSGSAEPISCFHDCQGFAGCLAVPLLCAGCSTTVGSIQ